MILTCPQCTTRYLLQANVLAPEGRNVKCSSCGEVWFQLPDPDELAELSGPAEDEAESSNDDESGSDFDDIPEGVKPEIEVDLVDSGGGRTTAAEDEERERLPFKALAGGYAAAACVFFVILGGLIMAKGSMLSTWPASAALYQALGMSVALPGEGLVFDQLAAQSKQGQVTIEGQIINLTGHKQIIPAIEASLRTQDGVVLETWVLRGDGEEISANADIPLEETYQSGHKDAHEVFLRFVLNENAVSKTASADDGNSPVPHQDDHAHRNAHEESAKSPAPASSHSH